MVHLIAISNKLSGLSENLSNTIPIQLINGREVKLRSEPKQPPKTIQVTAPMTDVIGQHLLL
jgi:hypothetical protein